jgi:4-hydroxy-3-polyprenylbenzoate decarboxylase
VAAAGPERSQDGTGPLGQASDALGQLPTERPPRVVVGITGASGAAYGVRLLHRLRELGVYTHLVATPAGVLNVHHELGLDRAALGALASESHSAGDIGACIASGSHQTEAMVVAPCSMKSLAAIAHGFGDNLLTRAAAPSA